MVFQAGNIAKISTAQITHDVGLTEIPHIGPKCPPDRTSEASCSTGPIDKLPDQGVESCLPGIG